MQKLSSRRSPSVADALGVREGADPRRVFVEGPRLVQELLATSWKCRQYFVADDFNHGTLIKSLEERGAQGFVCDESVMAHVSDLQSPPGILVLAERPHWEETAVLATSPLLTVILGGVQTPQNAGALLRVAEATGVQAVYQTRGGADLLGPKVLRASAGSAFRTPSFSNTSLDACLKKMAGFGATLVVADPRGDTSFSDWDWTEPTALIFGAEKGLTDPVPGATRVRIPMKLPVESLNVAVAAGLLLWEAARQRKYFSA